MKRRFTSLESLVVPIDRANVDTDALLPKQFLKSIRRTGFGDNLFDGWRYLDLGQPGQSCAERRPNPDFPLNQERYQGAQILLARANFGCGSSREHATWALHDWGIRALIAPSFAEIFLGNCYKTGLLPIVLTDPIVDTLFRAVGSAPGFTAAIDLQAQTLKVPTGETFVFAIDPFRKQCLLEGLDDIELTLANEASICAYERRRATEEPWLFESSES
jgi:3-isopropylmalate/(R)-2-methylmalate dehydratase small subunit